jgi:ATP-dependent DNA helicase PIF1
LKICAQLQDLAL